jgi:hypothetical protein
MNRSIRLQLRCRPESIELPGSSVLAARFRLEDLAEGYL